MSKSVEKMIRPEDVITSLRCEKRAVRRGVGVAARKFPAPAPAARDGFAPGEFSIMDLNLICALGSADNHKSFEWRGRLTSEATVQRYAERLSVKPTKE